jgi:hypothetical protein
MAPKVYANRQVIKIDGLASGSSPITKARGARVVMPQSYCLLNIEEKCTLLASEEKTRASNYRVPGGHVHQEYTQFFTNKFMECQLQMREVA